MNGVNANNGDDDGDDDNVKCIVNVIHRILVGFNIVMTYFGVYRTTKSTIVGAYSILVQQFQYESYKKWSEKRE